VLIDRIEADEDGSNIVAIARSSADAPEIDGTVNIAIPKRDLKKVAIGSLVNVKISAAGAYDLDAKLILPS
jgi:ribosomal protein S12 methylthiotransferase